MQDKKKLKQWIAQVDELIANVREAVYGFLEPLGDEIEGTDAFTDAFGWYGQARANLLDAVDSLVALRRELTKTLQAVVPARYRCKDCGTEWTANQDLSELKCLWCGGELDRI